MFGSATLLLFITVVLFLEQPQDLITKRTTVTIMSILNGAQHFTGISVILMNAHSMLTASDGIYLNYNIIIIAIVFAIIMLTTAFFVNRFGRKLLLTTFSFSTGLSFVILAGTFAFKNAGFDTTRFSVNHSFAVMVYVIVFKANLGIIPIISTGELFPTSLKAIGMTVVEIVYVIFSIISVYVCQWLFEAYGKPFVFSLIA